MEGMRDPKLMAFLVGLLIGLVFVVLLELLSGG
jgi:hypothetical protein